MNQQQSIHTIETGLRRFIRRLSVALGAGLLCLLYMSSPAAAAEFAGAADVYVLPQDQVIADDLYVTAPEIIINGTVEGDLLAAGAYVEINGAVNGSVMAAAAGVQINGVVQNSVRAAGMSVILNGTVRKDLIAAAGFGGPSWGAFTAEFPVPVNDRMLTPGLHLTRNSSVSGDAVLTGSTGRLAGVIGGDLSATVNRLDLGGSTGGMAYIQTNNLQVQDNASVAGVLTYVGPEPVQIEEGVAGEVVIVTQTQQEMTRAAPPNPLLSFLGWLWRVAIQLIGVALVAWLLWSFFPNLLRRPTAAIEAHPVEASLYGFVALIALVPLALALIFLGILFWGWFPGGVSFSAAAFGVLAVGWLLSPVFVGLWVGRRLTDAMGLDEDSPLRGALQTLLLGTLTIVLVANVVGVAPCVGPIAERIIYMLAFALAIGGLLLTRLRPAPPTAAAV